MSSPIDRSPLLGAWPGGRRRVLLATSGLALAASGLLGACSRDEPSPSAGAGGTGSDAARKAFDVASGGRGFDVGVAMASRTLRVFFDPQCPHCAALWRASTPLRNRVHMVWMPVAFINPRSAPQGAAILGAQDPIAAMDQHESLLASGQDGLAAVEPPDAALLAQIKVNTELWKSLDAGSVPYMTWRIGQDGPYGALAGSLGTEQLAQTLGL